MPSVGVIRLAHAEGLPLPSYETSGSAGLDLRAAVEKEDSVMLEPGEHRLIPTGFVFEIPDGFEGQVRPRSGLSNERRVVCLNSPGTIDSDYRGELMVMLVNWGDSRFVVERGMRIAQLVISPIARVELEERDSPGETQRGSGGFGSTGIDSA